MDTFGDLISAVQGDLNANSTSSLFSLTQVKSAINRAYINKVVAIFRWPETEDAKLTSTEASHEYYDYPQKWRSNSIWQLRISGVRYGERPDGSPLVFKDYCNWKEDNATSTDKKWSNFGRKFYVWPVPTTSGTNDIEVHGVLVPDELVGNDDETIFSRSTPECNEAIVLEASAVLKSKGEDDKGATFKSAEAKQILVSAFDKIKKEQAKYEKNEPFFYVPDLFGRNTGSDLTGRFDIN